MRPVREVLGERLKIERERKKLTQEEFGKKFNLSKQYISYYENGKREPGIDLVINIAKELDVTTDYLLGNSDYRTVQEELLVSKEIFPQEVIDKILLLPSEVRSFLLDALLMNDYFYDLITLMQYYSKCKHNFEPINEEYIIEKAIGPSYKYKKDTHIVELFNKTKLGFYIISKFENLLNNKVPEEDKKLSKEEAEEQLMKMFYPEGSE